MEIYRGGKLRTRGFIAVAWSTLIACTAVDCGQRVSAVSTRAVIPQAAEKAKPAATDSDASRGPLDVKLVAIRRLNDSPDRAWTPSGKPYVGWLGQDVSVSHGSSEPGRVRLLTFNLAGAGAEGPSVCGYVPDDARKDSGEGAVGLEPGGWTRFTTTAIVNAPGFDRYRLGIARGPWTKVAELTSLPAASNAGVLAEGDWGKLRMRVVASVPAARHGAASNLQQSAKRTEYLGFLVDSPDRPRKYAVRVFATNRQGERWMLFDCGAPILSQSPGPTREYVARLTVECRPYEYKEFTGVPYDPDPKLWTGIHWGHEGDKAIERIGDMVQLVGLARVEGRGADRVDQIYAPDGRHWREFPQPKTVEEAEVGMVTTGFTTFGPPLAGLIHFGSGLKGTGRSVRIEVFEAGGNIPGSNLGRKLASFKKTEPGMDIGVPLQDPGAAKYLQIAFRFSEPQWRSVGSMHRIPSEVLRDYESQAESFKKGLATSCLDLTLSAAGRLGWKYSAPTGCKSAERKNVIRWQGENREARLVAVLRSGRRVALAMSMGFEDGDRTYRFGFGDRVQPASGEDRSEVFLGDVAAFEVETRAFSRPTYLVAELPAPLSGD